MLLSRKLSPKIRNKYLKAIEWFNRSFRLDVEFDQMTRIVHLQTAFEALFKGEEKASGKTIAERICNGLSYVADGSTEILEWFVKFSNARNKIVHGDVKSPSLMYQHSQGDAPHRDHITTGQKLFVSAVKKLLCDDEYLPIHFIEQELIPNSLRAKKVKQIIESKGDLVEAWHMIAQLKQDELSLSKADTFELGTVFLPFLSKGLRENGRPEIAESIDKILNASDDKDRMNLYLEAQKEYVAYYDKVTYFDGSYFDMLRDAGSEFINFVVWRYLFFD